MTDAYEGGHPEGESTDNVGQDGMENTQESSVNW